MCRGSNILTIPVDVPVNMYPRNLKLNQPYPLLPLSLSDLNRLPPVAKYPGLCPRERLFHLPEGELVPAAIVCCLVTVYTPVYTTV